MPTGPAARGVAISETREPRDRFTRQVLERWVSERYKDYSLGIS